MPRKKKVKEVLQDANQYSETILDFSLKEIIGKTTHLIKYQLLSMIRESLTRLLKKRI